MPDDNQVVLKTNKLLTAIFNSTLVIHSDMDEMLYSVICNGRQNNSREQYSALAYTGDAVRRKANDDFLHMVMYNNTVKLMQMFKFSKDMPLFYDVNSILTVIEYVDDYRLIRRGLNVII